MSNRKVIKSAIESMMFIWGEPLSTKDIADILNIERKEAYECCKELEKEYEAEGRGIVIREVNKAFQFTTRKENLPYIERLCTPVRRRRLSQSALETLAIVAYRQPVTKGEIESVRGIRCDRVMEGLVKKGLVKEVGRSDAVGRPILFGTTDEFLQQFDLVSLKELPDIKDIEGLLEEEEAPDEVVDGITIGQISLDELARGDGAEPDGEAGADEADAQQPEEETAGKEAELQRSEEESAAEEPGEEAAAGETGEEAAAEEPGEEAAAERPDEKAGDAGNELVARNLRRLEIGFR